VNDKDVVVGEYSVGQSIYGFTWTAHGGFRTVTYPGGSQLSVTGVNDAGDLVGIYEGRTGAFHGMLATP
jgi:hypothetical protein